MLCLWLIKRFTSLWNHTNGKLSEGLSAATNEAAEQALSAGNRHVDNIVRHERDVISSLLLNRRKVDDHLFLRQAPRFLTPPPNLFFLRILLAPPAIAIARVKVIG